jgi:hypothetical protein
MRRSLDWIDWRPTLVAAGLVVVAVALLIVAFESVSSFERPQVLASMIDTIYWMAGGFIGACGTIAALTLTTLSLMEQLDTRRMGPRFLVHMRLTVLGAFATIALSVAALVLTIFPAATGDETSPPSWQVDVVYFGLLALTALMVGGFAVVLTSLYATIADVFGNLPGRWLDEILTDEEDAGAAEACEEAAERAERAAGPVATDGRGAGEPVATDRR